MRYHERLNIIFMRDNGPRRSFRMRRSRLHLLLFFIACLPFICAFLAAQCWFLWKENIKLRENAEKIAADYQREAARAERLENLEALLDEKSVPGRDIIIRRLSAAPGKPAPEVKETQPGPENQEGPGHEEFPVVDTGQIAVSNVQARAMRGNTLRIGVDLRNPNADQLLSGAVNATLVTAAGENLPLTFNPDDVGNFRISRFKRTVISARVPASVSLADSQVILEVKDPSGQDMYRNIFPVQH